MLFRSRDGANAWKEYEAKSRAIAENMERLRGLRLAKEAGGTLHSQSNTVQSPSPETEWNHRGRTKHRTRSTKRAR